MLIDKAIYERDHAAERSSLIALRLMMITLVRPSELREARWGEVDHERRQWTIPAERMKGRVRHIKPLSSQALLLFQYQRQITGHTETVVLVRPTAVPCGGGELGAALAGGGGGGLSACRLAG